MKVRIQFFDAALSVLKYEPPEGWHTVFLPLPFDGHAHAVSDGEIIAEARDGNADGPVSYLPARVVDAFASQLTKRGRVEPRPSDVTAAWLDAKMAEAPELPARPLDLHRGALEPIVRHFADLNVAEGATDEQTADRFRRRWPTLAEDVIVRCVAAVREEGFFPAYVNLERLEEEARQVAAREAAEQAAREHNAAEAIRKHVMSPNKDGFILIEGDPRPECRPPEWMPTTSLEIDGRPFVLIENPLGLDMSGLMIAPGWKIADGDTEILLTRGERGSAHRLEGGLLWHLLELIRLHGSIDTSPIPPETQIGLDTPEGHAASERFEALIDALGPSLFIPNYNVGPVRACVVSYGMRHLRLVEELGLETLLAKGRRFWENHVLSNALDSRAQTFQWGKGDLPEDERTYEMSGWWQLEEMEAAIVAAVKGEPDFACHDPGPPIEAPPDLVQRVKNSIDGWRDHLRQIVQDRSVVKTEELAQELRARGETFRERPSDHSRLGRILAGFGFHKKQVMRDGSKFRAFVREEREAAE